MEKPRSLIMTFVHRQDVIDDRCLSPSPNSRNIFSLMHQLVVLQRYNLHIKQFCQNNRLTYDGLICLV